MRKVISIFLLLLVFVIGLTGTVSAYSYIYADAKGIEKFHMAIVSYSGFEKATVDSVYYACNTWNKAAGKALVDSAGWRHSNTVYPLRNQENQITKGQRGTGGYVMQTSTWWSNGYILEADIDINVSHNTGNPGCVGYSFDNQNGFTHELGHVLGLDDLYDSADTEKTMYGYVSMGETKKRSLEQDDINGVYNLYRYR